MASFTVREKGARELLHSCQFGASDLHYAASMASILPCVKQPMLRQGLPFLFFLIGKGLFKKKGFYSHGIS